MSFQPMSSPVVGCLQQDNIRQMNVQQQFAWSFQQDNLLEDPSIDFVEHIQQPGFEEQVAEDFAFREPCSHMAFQPFCDCRVESTAAIQHETVLRMRNYWALKKRESRRRKRESDASNSNKTMATICKKVVNCWREETQDMDLDTRKKTFQQLLQQHTFRMLQLSTPNIEKSVLCNIQHTLNQVKGSPTMEKLELKRAACMMMLNNEGDASRCISNSQMAKLTGLHRRNFAAANVRLTQGENGAFPLQLCLLQRQRSSIITTEIKETIFRFWQTETRVSPNKKDVCRKRLGRNSYTRHPVHLLDESQVELFRRFETQYQDIKITLRSFESLKPWFVRKLKDQYTCCCIAHVQMIYLKEALNHIRQSNPQMHGSGCDCMCVICMPEEGLRKCGAAKYSYTSINTLCESVLCAKPNESAFHKLSCFKGTCQQCGSHKLMLCPQESFDNAVQITVKVFENVASSQNVEEGNKKKRKDLLHVQMGCKDFTSFLQRHITSFIMHNFVARWQSQQFKDCIQRFPKDVVVSVIDFAENYSFKEQNEIQSMHWYSISVTILVQITYVRDESENVLKFIHFYISDDKEHDTLFVQYCLQLHSRWLQKQGFGFLKRHWMWSDGCAAQFKSARPFFFVSRYYSMIGMEMVWSFFASGHGKGEHDGAGAVVKRALTHEQLKPDAWPMKCATDVVNFLKHKFNDEDNQTGVNRIFWEIKVTDVPRDKQWDCMRVTGSRSLHCIDGWSNTIECALRCRLLSCFCDFCMSQRWRRCLNITHVDSWKYLTLRPLDSDSSDSDNLESDESSDDEVSDLPMYSGHHDAISDALCLGDTFATNTLEEGADFYLLKCTKEKYKTSKSLRDAWGNFIEAYSYLVEGYYYELVDGEKYVYYIPVSQPTVLLASHLVRAIKIPMEPVDGEPYKFRLSTEVHENVYNSMPLVL